MKIELEVPDDLNIPEGCKAVLMAPKTGMMFLEGNGRIGVSVRDCDSYRHICFIPKHTWPAWLKCAAISRASFGYVAHIEKPFKNGNGEWCSVVPWCIHADIFTGYLPALEVGECLHNPNFKEG